MPRMGTLATLNECAYNPIRVTSFLEEALESGPHKLVPMAAVWVYEFWSHTSLGQLVSGKPN